MSALGIIMMIIKRTGTEETEEIEEDVNRRGDNPREDKRKKKATSPTRNIGRNNTTRKQET